MPTLKITNEELKALVDYYRFGNPMRWDSECSKRLHDLTKRLENNEDASEEKNDVHKVAEPVPAPAPSTTGWGTSNG